MARADQVRMVGPLERALFLKSLGPMEILSPAEIAVFAENARERHYREGDVIYEPGAPVPGFQAIVEGSVHASGNEYLDGMDLGEREAFGFLSMLARREQGLSVVATEDVVTLSFDYEVFLDILEDQFSILHHLLRRLGARTLEQRQQIPDGTYLAPEENQMDVDGDDLTFGERIRFMGRGRSTFSGVSMEALARVATTTPVVHFDAGETLWNSGDRADYALIIVRGDVECITQWGFSRFRAGPGYPLGNLERFAEEPRWFTAITETPVMAIYSDSEAMLDIMEDHDDMALQMVRAMAERMIAITEENAARAAVTAQAESAA